MYEKVSTDLNFVDREKNVGKFWRNQKIFEKSMKAREGCPTYTFYDGPPTANGKPHIGHVLTRVIKDMIPLTGANLHLSIKGVPHLERPCSHLQ